jgi:hypothetical protein
MAQLLHELWQELEGAETFCLAGPMGDDARRLLSPGARLVWTVVAGSHFEAMTKYYEHRGWGPYTPVDDWDYQPYLDEWLRVQASGRSKSP